MTIYESKTGYIKRISTGEIYQSYKLYLGKFDSIDDYTDSTEEEYNKYQEEERKRYENNSLQEQI